VNSKKWVTRIRHRVDQTAHESSPFGSQPVVLTPKGHDARISLVASADSKPIGLQTCTDDDLVKRCLMIPCGDDDLSVQISKPRNFSSALQRGSTRLGLRGEATSDFGEVDNRRRGRKQPRNARNMWFNVAQLVRGKVAQTRHPILPGALRDPPQTTTIGLVQGHQDLAADLVVKAVLCAEFREQMHAAPTEASLQRARLVVKACMNDAAVAARLVQRELMFLLEESDARIGIVQQELTCDRGTEDAASNDRASHQPILSRHGPRPRFRAVQREMRQTPSMRCQGSVFIVTGASSGIGAATARVAHARGAQLVLVARRGPLLERLARELPGSVAFSADVTEQGAMREVVDDVAARYGRIDILVNNAGQGLHVALEDVDLDDFRAVLELNVVAPLALMQLVLPVMRAQGAGTIINVSSGTSRTVRAGVGAYAATKAALNMLSAVAAVEFEVDGIVVSTVYPTLTATAFHSVLRAGSRQGGTADQADSPEHVAETICDLVQSGDREAVLAPPARSQST
jgi:short-subunit dehydrogenase